MIKMKMEPSKIVEKNEFYFYFKYITSRIKDHFWYVSGIERSRSNIFVEYVNRFKINILK